MRRLTWQVVGNIVWCTVCVVSGSQHCGWPVASRSAAVVIVCMWRRPTASKSDDKCLVSSYVDRRRVAPTSYDQSCEQFVVVADRTIPLSSLWRHRERPPSPAFSDCATWPTVSSRRAQPVAAGYTFRQWVSNRCCVAYRRVYKMRMSLRRSINPLWTCAFSFCLREKATSFWGKSGIKCARGVKSVFDCQIYTEMWLIAFWRNHATSTDKSVGLKQTKRRW